MHFSNKFPWDNFIRLLYILELFQRAALMRYEIRNKNDRLGTYHGLESTVFQSCNKQRLIDVILEASISFGVIIRRCQLGNENVHEKQHDYKHANQDDHNHEITK